MKKRGRYFNKSVKFSWLFYIRAKLSEGDRILT